MLRAARVGLSQGSKHHHYSIAGEFAAMRARIAHERLNKLQRRRLLRRTSTHNPVPFLIGEHREVLHRLHISPTGQRFPRAWDVDVPPGALSAARYFDPSNLPVEIDSTSRVSGRRSCAGTEMLAVEVPLSPSKNRPPEAP